MILLFQILINWAKRRGRVHLAMYALMIQKGSFQRSVYRITLLATQLALMNEKF